MYHPTCKYQLGPDKRAVTCKMYVSSDVLKLSVRVFPNNQEIMIEKYHLIQPAPGQRHHRPGARPLRIMPAEKLAEFGTFSGKFHACLVYG